MKEWRLAEAKNKFTELVNKALSVGPQAVRRRDDIVIIISKAEYDLLIGEVPTFKQLLLNPPRGIEDINLERDSSPMRTVDL